eukprot:NODE_2551_length_1553_cov_20.026573_g2197_i0.p1 GENE.NODE_2551_length_1553_cov_20.026573_g2197_i0~~NODE_2551_length_1553_cov_20.026573_g2197_i0.p1  ORF type:complete len:491 (+),score=68.99 NODE_2551_length_1553_cov_20.026573_g2197_i0:135-1475(+)
MELDKDKNQVSDAIELSLKIEQSLIDNVSLELNRTMTESQKAVALEVQDGLRKTDNRIDKGKLTTYLVAASLLLFVSAVAFMVNFVITKPMFDLMDAMADVANMRIEDAYVNPSALYEIQSMTIMFCRMSKNLMEYRSYMPQSILKKEFTSNEDESTEIITNDSKLHSQDDNRSRTKKRLESISFKELHVIRTSIVMVNISGFHHIVAQNHTFAEKFHSTLLDYMLNVVHQTRGLAEPFFGDHLMVSYNTLSKSGIHHQCACRASIKFKQCIQIASKQLLDMDIQPSMTIGISSGQVHIGTMGCSGMKRFSIIGPCVNLAYMLERLCCLYEASVCVDQVVQGQTSTQFYFKIVDRVLYNKYSENPMFIYQLVSEKNQDTQDEWMYEVNDAEAGDPHKKYNSAWKLFVNGKFTEAKEQLHHCTSNEYLLKLIDKKVGPNYVNPNILY